MVEEELSGQIKTTPRHTMVENQLICSEKQLEMGNRRNKRIASVFIYAMTAGRAKSAFYTII